MEKLQGKLNMLIRSCLVTLGVHEKAFSFLWHLVIEALQETPSGEKSGTNEILPEEEHSHQQAESSGHEEGIANTPAGRSEK